MVVSSLMTTHYCIIFNDVQWMIIKVASLVLYNFLHSPIQERIREES